MRSIPLTQGFEAKVDDGDYEFLMQWKWCVNVSPWISYAISWDRDTKKLIRMHRLIMRPAPRLVVDHIDRDGLNNQRDNLRIATTSQNAANTKGHKDRTSSFKGVAVNTKAGPLNPKPWVAGIAIAGKRKHLGTFLHEEDAARAYDLAAINHYGEFALTNFGENK